MKLLLGFSIVLIVFVPFLFTSCDKTEIIGPRSELAVDRARNSKPRRTEIELGSIRGYFGDDYFIFNQHIEKVQPVDSFSNCYFYGACNDDFHQINLIRCNSNFVIALYILGYPVDSLPESLPVPTEFGKYTEIQFYPFGQWNSTDPVHYTLNSFYGSNVFITDFTDEIVTGTFEGPLRSPSGNILYVSEGEFKIKIFRKRMPCGNGAKSDQIPFYR